MDLRRLRDAAIIGFALSFIFLIIIILAGDPFGALDRRMQDQLEKSALKPNSEIVLVDLDEASVTQLGDQVEWPGLWLPGVMEQLGEARAIGVVLPLYRPYPFPAESQAKLRMKEDSLTAWFRLPQPRTQAILDSLFSDIGWEKELLETLDSIKSETKLFLGFQMLEERQTDAVLRMEIPVEKTPEEMRESEVKIVDKPDFIAPPDKLVRVAAGVGHVDVISGKDELVRSVPLISLCKDKFFPSLAFSIFWNFQGQQTIDLPLSRTLRHGSEDIHTGDWYGHRIHYTSDIDHFTRISIADILNGNIPSETFADKIVFLGASVPPYAMCVATPVNPQMPMMVLQANLLSNLMHDKQSVPVHPVFTFIIMFVLGILGALAVMLRWRKFTLPAFAVLLGLFYLAVATSAMRGTRIGFFTPVVVSGLSIVAGYFVYYYTEGKRRTYIQQMVTQFFPAEESKEYIERFMDLPYIKLNHESTVMAVYLDFEKREKSLQEALKSFEEFRSTLLAITRKHGGLRMTFTGNVGLFLFTGKQSYAQAAQASLEVRRFFTNFNAKYITEEIGEFKLGIGLAGGETLITTLGKVPLVDLAIFGSPVLVARELALLNFELKTKILLEGLLVEHMPSGSKVREMGELEIVGAKHTVFEYLR